MKLKVFSVKLLSLEKIAKLVELGKNKARAASVLTMGLAQKCGEVARRGALGWRGVVEEWLGLAGEMGRPTRGQRAGVDRGPPDRVRRRRLWRSAEQVAAGPSEGRRRMTDPEVAAQFLGRIQRREARATPRELRLQRTPMAAAVPAGRRHW